MNINILYLILFLLLSPFLLFILHVFVVRIVFLFNKKISNQKLLFYCILLFNIPVLLISLIILKKDNFSLYSIIYILLTFNFFAYFYGEQFINELSTYDKGDKLEVVGILEEYNLLSLCVIKAESYKKIDKN